MKFLSLVEVVVLNVVLLSLLAWVTGDYADRAAYWGTEPKPFTPTTIRYPLFMRTSAVNGSISIPGLLSVDWQQIIVLVLLLTDALYLLSMRGRRGARPQEAAALSE